MTEDPARASRSSAHGPRRVRPLSIAAVLCSLAAWPTRSTSAPPTTAPRPSFSSTATREVVLRAMASHHRTGVAIAVTRGRQILWHDEYGITDVRTGISLLRPSNASAISSGRRSVWATTSASWRTGTTRSPRQPRSSCVRRDGERPAAHPRLFDEGRRVPRRRGRSLLAGGSRPHVLGLARQAVRGGRPCRGRRDRACIRRAPQA